MEKKIGLNTSETEFLATTVVVTAKNTVLNSALLSWPAIPCPWGFSRSGLCYFNAISEKLPALLFFFVGFK